jgi:transketolase
VAGFYFIKILQKPCVSGTILCMKNDLVQLARLIRYWILTSTTEAGSGHPTSSLSATDLMTVLMFGGFFKFIFDDPAYPNNDRLIFSKGHAMVFLRIKLLRRIKMRLNQVLNVL